MEFHFTLKFASESSLLILHMLFHDIIVKVRWRGDGINCKIFIHWMQQCSDKRDDSDWTLVPSRQSKWTGHLKNRLSSWSWLRRSEKSAKYKSYITFLSSCEGATLQKYCVLINKEYSNILNWDRWITDHCAMGPAMAHSFRRKVWTLILKFHCADRIGCQL